MAGEHFHIVLHARQSADGIAVSPHIFAEAGAGIVVSHVLTGARPEEILRADQVEGWTRWRGSYVRFGTEDAPCRRRTLDVARRAQALTTIQPELRDVVRLRLWFHFFCRLLAGKRWGGKKGWLGIRKLENTDFRRLELRHFLDEMLKAGAKRWRPPGVLSDDWKNAIVRYVLDKRDPRVRAGSAALLRRGGIRPAYESPAALAIALTVGAMRPPDGDPKRERAARRWVERSTEDLRLSPARLASEPHVHRAVALFFDALRAEAGKGMSQVV